MPEIVNRETHHEKSDVNVRALFKFFVVFIVFAVVTHLLLFMQFKAFRKMFRGQTAAPLTAVTRPLDAAVPPQPRLQPFETRNVGRQINPPNTNTPVTDMEQMRAAEEKALHTPGWIDRQKGIVRLPIEVAKELVIQRGLPAPSGAPASPPAGPAASTPPPQGAKP